MWQPVLMISGYFISLLGFAMLIPAGVDVFIDKHTNSPFITSSAIVLSIGLLLSLTNIKKINKFSLHQGFLLTSFSWISVALLSTLPFLFSETIPNFADVFFESFSGITATGATVIADVEALPKSILLWRSMLNALGGIGIVIFAIAVMPFLGIGGMQIFQRENSDFGEQFMPKIGDVAKRIILLYFLLLISCAFSYYIAGMGLFDAINHSLTTISTAGFSTKNHSFASFNSVKIELVAITFMILASLPMSYYLLLFYKNRSKKLKNAQIYVFLRTIFIYIAIVSTILVINDKYDWLTSLRYSAFNVISIMTTTGYSSVDYMSWGSFTLVLFLIFSLTGGCTGSTTGSIKIFRWQAFFAYIKNALTKASTPHLVNQPSTRGIAIGQDVINSVLTFIGIYLTTMVAIIVLLAISGQPFEVAVSGGIACFTNTGPGVGDLIGPAGNYSTLSDFAKYVLSIGMLFGRLEVITILIIFTPNFWKN